MTKEYPAASRHLPLKECFPGVWFASSQIAMGIPMGLKVKFSRNMVAVLGAGGWTLLNPVRLSKDAEDQLLEKGPIRHAVRLGTFHGCDDEYYVDRFGVEFWSVTGKQAYKNPPIKHEISEDGAFPIQGAKVVVFKGAAQAECVVFLPEHRLLVTCDSVQHYELNDPLITWPSRLLMKRMGFFTPCVIGPFWLKGVTPEGGRLRADFDRILELDFDSLISAHGSPKVGGAKEALAANVTKLK